MKRKITVLMELKEYWIDGDEEEEEKEDEDAFFHVTEKHGKWVVGGG